MEPFFIILTIAMGIILILIEIFFIPGTTIVGILGFLVVIAGIWYTYSTYGSTAGMYTLISSSVVCLGLAIYGFRSGAWNKFSQKQVIDSKVNDHITLKLEIGEKGKTVSALRPMGTAIFQDEIFEVSTLGNFVEPNSSVKIIEIRNNNRDIVVEKC